MLLQHCKRSAQFYAIADKFDKLLQLQRRNVAVNILRSDGVVKFGNQRLYVLRLCLHCLFVQKIKHCRRRPPRREILPLSALLARSVLSAVVAGARGC